MTMDTTVLDLQRSVRRLRFGLAAAAIGVAALLLGGMEEGESEGESKTAPSIVSISTTAGTLPAHTVLYRAWSDGRIERRILQTDSGERSSGWQTVQRP
ncbi:MAG: hypothetical protein MK116_10070 [Phycisphaerales bacterium]|nr:hypothetical protein [Phycisphaerales bacterium]